MNIYLDIDGVLITKDGKPAQHVVEFLEYATKNHHVFWLTIHCRGDAKAPVYYLKDKLPVEAIPLLEKIKPTNWQTIKTEAIDFSQDFCWFDDYIMQAEKDILMKHKAGSKFVQIDLKKEPKLLKNITNIL